MFASGDFFMYRTGKRGSFVRKRERKMTIRLSESEWSFIDSEVAKTTLKKEAFVRARIFRKPIPLQRHPDISMLITELNRIGNNVNQLAKNSNMGKPVPKHELLLAMKAFETMEHSVLEVMKGGTDKDLDKEV